MKNDFDIAKVAKLAFLSLSPERAAHMQKELAAILGYMEILNKIDTADIAAMSHVHGSANVTRNDDLEPSTPAEEILANAPDRSGRFLRTPLIVES